MPTITLYILTIFLTGAQSVCVKLYGKTNKDIWSFNTYRCGTAFIAFLLLGVFHFRFHFATLLYGISFGCLLTTSTFCGHKALCCGPLSLTSPIVAFSLIIPTVYGILFQNDPVTFFTYLGFIFLSMALVCFNLKKKESLKEKNKINKAWIFYLLITFFCNGINSILQVEHQQRYPNAYKDEFMIFATLIPFLFFSFNAFFRQGFSSLKRAKGKIYGIFTGLANGGANFFTLFLASTENASVLYPILSAGTLFMAIFSGIFLFKEKQSFFRFLGFSLAVASIVFLKI